MAEAEVIGVACLVRSIADDATYDPWPMTGCTIHGHSCRVGSVAQLIIFLLHPFLVGGVQSFTDDAVYDP